MPPYFLNNTTGELVCQDDIELVDGGRRWKERKSMSLKVSRLMRKYDEERADKILRCGTYLVFIQDPTGRKNLHSANFCRERLCPMCQWRRSLRLSVQADKIYGRLTDQGYKHIFLTLSVRNCTASDLPSTIDHMYESLTRLTRSKRWKESFPGLYGAFEITYNSEACTYHPHFHLILTVKPEYFTSNLYWSHDQFIAAWRKAARLDYDPSVDIEAVRQKQGQSLTSAVVEACKYPVKSAEINSSDVLRTIDYALRGRRLLRWQGVAKAVRKEMQLDDVEDGDLIHTDDVPTELTDETVKIAYAWRHGVYIPIDFAEVELKEG